MDITVRTATLKDVPFIGKLMGEHMFFSLSPLRRYSEEEREKFKREFSQDLKKRLEEKSLLAFVAEEKENLLGFCLVEEVIDRLTEQKEVYINNISVVEEAMGKWVSNKLMKQAELYAKEKGVPVLTGDITVSNRRSMLFCTRYFKYKPERVTLLKYLE